MGVKHPVVCRCSNKVLALKKGTKEHFTMNGSIIWSIGYNRMFCNRIYCKFSSGGCFFYECWLKMWFQLFTGFVLIVAVFTTLDAESIYAFDCCWDSFTLV